MDTSETSKYNIFIFPFLLQIIQLIYFSIVLDTNARDSPPLVISADKPNSDGPSDQVISLVTGVFKELGTIINHLSVM